MTYSRKEEEKGSLLYVLMMFILKWGFKNQATICSELDKYNDALILNYYVLHLKKVFSEIKGS